MRGMSERQQPRAKNIAHANDGGHGPPGSAPVCLTVPMRLVHNPIFGKTESFDRFSAEDIDYV